MISQDVVGKLCHVHKAVSHVKKVIRSVRERSSLHRRLSIRVTPNEDMRWLSKLDIVRKFLDLNVDDIEVLEQKLPDQARHHLYRANAVKSTLKTFVNFAEIIEKSLNKLMSEEEPTIHLVSFLHSSEFKVPFLGCSCVKKTTTRPRKTERK